MDQTLISIAMLKIKFDNREDYLSYLNPFIEYILSIYESDIITDINITNLLKEKHGLIIPPRIVQIVLKRFAKKNILKKSDHVYRLINRPDIPEWVHQKDVVEKQIDILIDDFIDYANSNFGISLNKNNVIDTVLNFFSKFSVICLRNFLRATALPKIEDNQSYFIILSNYIKYISHAKPNIFNIFMVLCEGNMLANALLCPDMMQAKKDFSKVCFYFDTPIILSLLELNHDYKVQVSTSLIIILKKLKANLYYFSHTLIEVENIIFGSSNNINNNELSYPVLIAARRKRLTASDLLILSNTIQEKLQQFGLVKCSTPTYNDNRDYQIDESAFEHILDEEISYFNPRAKENDINSVRSIYCLRKNTVSKRIEDCGFIFVTSNSAYASSADTYNKNIDSRCQVSTVITDFSLMNLAWLKLPMDTPNIPMTELIALSYSALEPTKEFLCKVLLEIDKLLANGQISPDVHQLLRTQSMIEELFSLTLGDEESLTERDILKIIDNIKEEGRKETSSKIFQLKQEISSLEQKNKNYKNNLKLQVENIRHSAMRLSNILAFTSLIVALSLNYYCICIESIVYSFIFTILNFFFTFKYKNIAKEIFKKIFKFKMIKFKNYRKQNNLT